MAERTVFSQFLILTVLWDLGGARSNTQTAFYPFSGKREKNAFQFYDLIPFGNISVTPGMSDAQGMQSRKYAGCFLCLSPSVCERTCERSKLLHAEVLLCTLECGVCGCEPPVPALRL